MERWPEVTLSRIWRVLVEYRPFLATVIAVVLIVTLLPAERERTAGPLATGLAGTEAEGTASALRSEALRDTETVPGSKANSGAGVTGSGARPGAPSSLAGDPKEFGPDCDIARGRLKIPDLSAPPCVREFRGDNGGATYQGITRDTITLVAYIDQTNPQTDAILRQAGLADSEDELRQQYADWVDFFGHHVETYGRQPKLTFFKATGRTTDQAAARADALKIATEIRPFAVMNLSGHPAFYDELAARGILGIRYYPLRARDYIRNAPYLWSPAEATITQQYAHAAEYVGKRLVGRNAKFAGDPRMQGQKRSFGLLYNDYYGYFKTEADAFEKDLTRYGVRLSAKASYPNDIASQQEQARTIMSKFVAAGVTTIIFPGNVFDPIVFTEEATRQGYFPEWVITGTRFTDLNFTARLYDQAQWAHAFGLSSYGVRYPNQQFPCWRLHEWHHRRPPSAQVAYCILWQEQMLLFYGIHLAGPNLTPATFRDALFSMPPMYGSFQPSTAWPGFSYGKSAGWPYDDYVAQDDMGEVWWDPNTQGEDEFGNDGQGMYQFVEGGKRYLPGRWPTSDVRVFEREGAVAWYESNPDKSPSYPHPDH